MHDLTVVVLAGLLLAGCHKTLAERTTQPAEMRTAVLVLAPLGTPMAEAARRLALEGFRCGAVQRGTFGAADTLLYAYCDAYASAGWPVSRRWQLALVDSAGHLRDVRAKTGLIGP